MASGKIYTPHPTPLDPLLAIGLRNNRKSLAYFSHMAPLILFFFSKRQSQKGPGPSNFAFMLKNRVRGINRFDVFILFCLFL